MAGDREWNKGWAIHRLGDFEEGLRVPVDDDHSFRRNVINRSGGIVITVSGAS
jgi:hypothetical protein